MTGIPGGRRDPKGAPQFGLVAEEVAKVNPDLVVADAASVSYTYDSVYNRLASMVGGARTTAYGYNPVGSVRTRSSGGIISPFDYSYNPAGSIASESRNRVPSGCCWFHTTKIQ